MTVIHVSESQRKVTGSCDECYVAWNTLRRQGWKVSQPIYWEGRGRGLHAAIEFVRAQDQGGSK